MIDKKNPKVDLRNKRTLFFEIGMLLAMATVFGAFQIQTNDKILVELEPTISEPIPDEFMPITRPDQPKPPPPPEPKTQKVIEIIDNDGIEDPDPFYIQEPDAPIVIIPVLEEEPEEEDPVDIAEIMPSYKGGYDALLKYLQNNVAYPKLAIDNGIEGRVFVRFVVNKVGKVENVSIARGVDKLLNEEAMRVVRNMPDWNPGMQNFKTISVNYTIPISFKLN